MKRLIVMSIVSLILLVPVYAGASDLGGIRFSFVRGDVQVRTDDTDDWVPASINMPLREGDRIWVPEEGTAELQVKDGSYLRLADRSALEILTLDGDSCQTYLTEGRLYANFRGSRDSLLQIDTSTSSVRAHEKSKFKVDVPERGPVHISVLQGEVTVENTEGRIKVASGEVLSLGDGAYSEKSVLGAPDEWEKWNWERDRTIAERRPPSRHLPEELQPYSNDFYDNGRWVYTPDYGYVWTPAVSVSVGWAPYRSGRWVWIGGDYVWVSYEPWGWVPYHYGRWTFALSLGWCWVPPARGAVYWGPGYVGWVYTSRHVAWVPLAPREVYYGRGHHGPHSVNITNVNVTNVHVDKVVYKNVRINNAVTTVNHDTFVRGKPAEARVKENPFLTEKIHVGRPPIKPEKTSRMPVVREVPQAKRPPEPVRRVDVRELKEQRPMVKSKEASVFAPDTRAREMPVKASETRPMERPHRAKELRQPSRKAGEPTPSVPAEKRVGQPGPSETNVQTTKGPGRSERTLERTRPPAPTPAKVQEQPGRADKGLRQEPAVRTPKDTKKSERALERTRQPVPTPTKAQEQTQPGPADRGLRQEPAVRTPNEMRPPERGMDKNKESRAPERVIKTTRPLERMQGNNKEVSTTERVNRRASEPKTPEKRMERLTEPRNPEKGSANFN